MIEAVTSSPYEALELDEFSNGSLAVMPFVLYYTRQSEPSTIAGSLNPGL